MILRGSDVFWLGKFIYVLTTQFEPLNSDRELQNKFIPVCKSGGCSVGWRLCEWVGVCPHSDERDLYWSLKEWDKRNG